MSASQVTRSDRVSQVPSISAANVSDELVMLDLDRGAYYGLNDIASDIWNRIEAPITVDALCEELVNAYDVDPSTCETDTLNILQWLLDRKLIRLDDRKTP